MEWTDDGLVLGVRRHGESSVILEAMTARHGRHLGVVRGGRGNRLRPILQPGNGVRLTWRARLEDHLGLFLVEGAELRAARLMESQRALYGAQALAAHLRLLPERDPHEDLFRAATLTLDGLGEPALAGELMIRFELALLEELGFGLDLSACALTGRNDALGFVSPRSGRAVGREAGRPWAARLLALPAFLTEAGARPDPAALGDGFALTGFFLDRHVWSARGVAAPDERAGFIAAVHRELTATEAA